MVKVAVFRGRLKGAGIEAIRPVLIFFVLAQHEEARSVRLSGYENWTYSADGLILESKGNYDEAEYQRQMSDEGGEG